MKQRVMGFAVVTVALTLLVAASAWAEGVWVSSDGKKLDISRGMLALGDFGEGATAVNIDDLVDGETRVVGVGERQVTLSRRGDEVTISRANSKSEIRDTTCTIGVDSCQVVTFDDDPARVMVIKTRSQNCSSADGDCDVDVMAMIDADASHGNHFIQKIHTDGHATADGMHMIQINKSVECSDDEDCDEIAMVIGDGEAGLSQIVVEALEGVGVDGVDGLAKVHLSGAHGGNFFVMKSDHVTLRCDEGDTTMQVDKEEADDVFLCPKHSTPLEQVKDHPRMLQHRIKVHRDKDTKD